MYGSGGSVTLGELIARLEREDRTKLIKNGFGEANTYRGFYDDLAFEPATNVTVKEMLAQAMAVLGKTLTGYKGGDYKMTEHTDTWIAKWGELGEALTPRALECMLTHG